MIFVICDIHQEITVRGVCGAHNTKDKYGILTEVTTWLMEVSGVVLGNLSSWTSGHGTDRLSRNVGTDLPLHAA